MSLRETLTADDGTLLHGHTLLDTLNLLSHGMLIWWAPDDTWRSENGHRWYREVTGRTRGRHHWCVEELKQIAPVTGYELKRTRIANALLVLAIAAYE